MLAAAVTTRTIDPRVRGKTPAVYNPRTMAESARDKVLSEVSKASGTPRSRLKDSDKLKGDLGISHENFVVLAQNLRSFIRANKPSQTLLLREIETATMTVGDLIDLVAKRSGQ